MGITIISINIEMNEVWHICTWTCYAVVKMNELYTWTWMNFKNRLLNKKQVIKPLATWFSWLDCVLCTKLLVVQFPVRAHAQIVSLIPGWDVHRREPTNVFLSHQCFSLPLSLSVSLCLCLCLSLSLPLPLPLFLSLKKSMETCPQVRIFF